MESAGAGAGDGDFSALGWFPITLLCPTRTQLHVNLLPCRHPRGGTQNPEPPSQNIRASHWLWEVSLSSNSRCPCAGQYKDTVCIATIRVSYLNSL